MIRGRIGKYRDIHVKLSKADHLAFKTRLLQHEMSMQRAFEAFARAVGSGFGPAINIVERDIRRRLRDDLVAVGIKPSKQGPLRKSAPLDELDVESLYDLINDEETPEGADAEEEPPVNGRIHHEAA